MLSIWINLKSFVILLKVNGQLAPLSQWIAHHYKDQLQSLDTTLLK